MQYEIFVPNNPSTNNELPLVIHKDSLKKETYGANWHDEIELLFITSGEGSVTCNYNKHDVTAGDIVVINSKHIHYSATKTNLQYYCIIIQKQFCMEIGIDLNKILFNEKISDKNATSLFNNALIEYSSHDKYSKTSVKAAVTLLLIYLCRNFSIRKDIITFDKGGAGIRHTMNIINYIEDNLKNKITCNDIARHLNISKYHIIHEFKRITGKTINETIITLRCERAKQLLADNQITISQISEECGFANYSYFSNVFKKYTGFSPLKYRQRHQRN